MGNSEKDLGDKKWNGEENRNNNDVNEGFSGKNISENYDPSDGKLRPETETDDEGNTEKVKRARDVENYETEAETSGEEIKQQKTPENRDKNSDTQANRYSNSNPENHRDRGNNTGE